MNPSGYLLGTAGLAAITAFWGQIKGFFVKFRSIFIVKAEIKHNLASAVIQHLWKNYRCGLLGNKTYTSVNNYVRSRKRVEWVVFEDIGESLTFFKGIYPIYILYTKASRDEGQTVSISFIRGTYNLEKLLLEAIKEYNNLLKYSNETRNNRHYISHQYGIYGKDEKNNLEVTEAIIDASSSLRPIGYIWDDLGAPITKAPFSALFYPEEVQKFIFQLERWKESEDWYKDRGLPWRLGTLLTGLPGTGKSSFVRAIGQHFDFPIDIYDLSSMSNQELTNFWKQSLNKAPCIVLIEDIDRIFNKDKLIQNNKFSGKGNLTMDGILNTISGVEPSDGILMFITANNISKLDTALGIPNEDDKSSRPGRLDRTLTFSTMSKDCRQLLAEMILSDCQHLISKTVDDGANETGAQFSKRCSDIALREFWFKEQK